jgi:hypothetical protein
MRIEDHIRLLILLVGKGRVSSPLLATGCTRDYTMRQLEEWVSMFSLTERDIVKCCGSGRHQRRVSRE